ncbi:MAG: DUF547 domain-containing protein [Bacteroidota bacterium]
MRQCLASAFLMLCWWSYAQDGFFVKAEMFFEHRMVNNRINYQNLQSDTGDLDSLVFLIANMNETTLEDDEYLAFYINAYNLLVIKGVINRYPFRNLLEQEGFFDQDQYLVAGEAMTLDDLEFKKLFARERDPRFHFVLNCAAYSCPTPFNGALLPHELEDQLEYAIKLVMDRDDYVFVDHARKKVLVSKVFEWYVEDFSQHQTLRQFINRNRFTSIPRDYDIDYLPYDWRLNDSNPPNDGD